MCGGPSKKSDRGLSIARGIVRRDIGAEFQVRSRTAPEFASALKPDGDTAMRFMIIVKATKVSETEVMSELLKDDRWQRLFAEMATYHEELQRAGVLLDASGLQPSSKGWRVTYSGGGRSVIDGPFTETKELIAGYTLIQVKSKEEAKEWVRRFPNPYLEDGEIEVRQLYDLEDFGSGDTVERFRELGIGTEK
jgi:hypothetical protein